MGNNGVCLCLGILLVLSSVQTAQDYDQFVLRWQLDKDLKCIHREVDQLGRDPTPKPGDPSFQGFRTYCFFLQEGAHAVFVYKWPSDDELLAVFFVRGKPPYTPVFKEGDRIKECQTLSDLDSSTQPQWINSKDTRELDRKLKTHCFFKKTEDFEPYKYVFKVSYHPERGQNSGYFESKRILFLIPNKKNYYIASRDEELDAICTRCDAGGGFSQTPLVKGNNITELLQKASKDYFG